VISLISVNNKLIQINTSVSVTGEIVSLQVSNLIVLHVFEMYQKYVLFTSL